MKAKKEILDIVDAADCVIGREERRALHRRGLMHRAVHILVLDRTDRVYVQKRSKQKFTAPRCYDSSSSGHLGSGESYNECADREIVEELNLTHDKRGPLRPLFKIAACRETGWEHVWVYVCRAHGAVRPDVREIESGRFWAWDEIWRLIQQRPADCADGFARVVREVKARGGLKCLRAALR